MIGILEALFLTLTLELPFCFFLKEKNLKTLGFFVGMNLVTNLGFNLLYVYGFGYLKSFLISDEILVFVIEALLLYRFDHRRKVSALLGILANAFSLGIGMLINDAAGGSSTRILTILFVALAVALLECFLYVVRGILMEKKAQDRGF